MSTRTSIAIAIVLCCCAGPRARDGGSQQPAVLIDPRSPGNVRAERVPPATPSGDALAGDVVWVPGGSLLLGANPQYPEEHPPKPVEVGGFWIDRFEVTNAEFRRFVSATSWVTSAERADLLGFPAPGSAVFRRNPDETAGWSFVAGAQWRHPEGPESSIDGRDHEPVVQISLEDAKAYADWLGRRLPTEAEWEHAARQGPTGESLQARWQANTWQGHFPYADEGQDGYPGRAPVGRFPPNAAGLHDLLGNVWEWTTSTYFPTHRPSPAMLRHRGGLDPRQPGVEVAVIKGGSFLCSPTHCDRYRPAARQPQERTLGTNHIGFRTVTSDSTPVGPSTFGGDRGSSTKGITR